MPAIKVENPVAVRVKRFSSLSELQEYASRLDARSGEESPERLAESLPYGLTQGC